MKIEIKSLTEHPSIKLIELSGELDILGSEKLIQEVLPIIEAGSFYLIADLHNLEYINSAGIYGLLRCFTKAKEKAGFFKLIAVNERIKEILEVVGVTKLIVLYHTLDEALTATNID